MADASHSPDMHAPEPQREHAADAAWAQAFAALPLAAPPRSLWPEIAAQAQMVPATGAPRRRRIAPWLALAASLAAIALIVGLRQSHDDAAATTDAAAIAASQSSAAQSSDSQPSTSQASVSQSSSSSIAGSHDAGAAASVAVAPSPSAMSTPTMQRRTDGIATTNARAIKPASPPRTRAQPDVRGSDRPIARQRVAPTSVETDRGSAIAATERPHADADANDADLEALYAASAQWEALLAYARDPRMDTGPSAALASELEGQLAGIDARLAQPGLDLATQRQLWQARVDTLQQTAEFESRLRVLAAYGERYDGALVSVD